MALLAFGRYWPFLAFGPLLAFLAFGRKKG